MAAIPAVFPDHEGLNTCQTNFVAGSRMETLAQFDDAVDELVLFERARCHEQAVEYLLGTRLE